MDCILDLYVIIPSYMDCPESICPFWITWELVVWPWCNLAASQRKPYCTCVNSNSPVGLVSRQWDAIDRACVLCDRPVQNGRASRLASSRQCACPIYSSHADFFDIASHHPRLSTPYNLDLAPCNFWLFPKIKSPFIWRWFENAMVTQYTSSFNSVLLPTYQSHGRVTVLVWAVRSPLTGCQVTSRPRNWFSRYSKWTDIFWTALVHKHSAVLGLCKLKSCIVCFVNCNKVDDDLSM